MALSGSITESRSYSLTLRLWPEVGQMDQNRQIESLETIVQLLYLLPFAAIGLIWLILRTDFARLADNLDALAILFAAMVLLLLQPFTIRIRLGQQGDELHLSSSLAPLVMWSTLFISGAAGLWALVLATAVAALWRSGQLTSYGQNPLWKPLSFFVEQVGIYVFSTLVAATIYLAAGGAFPITGVTFEDWLPALVAVIIGALLSGLLLLPLAIQLNSLSGTANSLGDLVRFYAGAVALPLLMGPFAIIIALLNAEGRTLALVFVLIGIYLVNRLAHHMSLAEKRSRQQAHELDQLERLAQQLIEAPADASTLPQVLVEALPGLFPTERVVIHLFEPREPRAWSPFDLKQPQTIPDVAQESWQALCQAAGSYVVVPNVTLPGERRSFGEALMVKIVVEAAEQAGEGIECVGGVYLLRHKSEGKSMDSLATVDSLASQIGIALDRAQNHAEMLAFQKTQQELEFAGRIQTSFLPTTVPEAENWQISAVLDSARQTSGDFYDFIPLDRGLIGIVMADVSDKGTGAALYMALSRTLIRTYAMESGDKPGTALTRANERIRADTESDQFVTLIYGVLDPVKGRLTYANAGHNPGYLLRAVGGAEDGEVVSLTRTGIPLGMFEGMEWQQAQVQIEPGDVLLLYTDGVTEAQNAVDEEYGDDRLIAIGQQNKGRPAAEIQEAIMTSIDDFVGEAPQFDDITLMVVSRDA
jgi:serine phosphatase RsbU (regulator of sigma subunit)